jgi:ATP-binding cassette subfamily B (MDR/TAP) protein 1
MVEDVSTSNIIQGSKLISPPVLANGEYNPVQFFVIYTAVINGAEGAGSLLSFVPNMAQASAAANRILSFRERPKETGKEVQGLHDSGGGVQIELKDVWFKYPTRDTPIFTGLSLTVFTLKCKFLLCC